jgi:Putative zinc ribbon domain
MANERTCISCGMPLRQLSDYAANDPQKNWCRHCAREDGSMKSYEEVLDGMSAFLARTHCVDSQVARTMSANMMAKLPAWAGRQRS